ncbi:hypothetical protein EZV62_027733 [Acer yangbiense]|uniref:DUF4283 domain-containing protein n=1 Tax=Acer yangbiense TaxID=1000413 RepID=A0A5C7GV93_9ROSI|nr:hypothetical protein EZV62_027733 [Acer yangbiense]
MVNWDVFMHLIPKIWKIRQGVDIEVVDGNMFSFTFRCVDDRRQVFHGGPWRFDKALLALAEPSGKGDIQEIAFTKVAFWIQIHNVLLLCTFGECVGKYIRIQVAIDLSKPLHRILKVDILRDGKEMTMLLRYEKLPEHCFRCGKIRHVSKALSRNMISRTDTGNLDSGGRGGGKPLFEKQQVVENRGIIAVQGSDRTKTGKGTVRVTEMIGKPATTVSEVEKESLGVHRNLRGHLDIRAENIGIAQDQRKIAKNLGVGFGKEVLNTKNLVNNSSMDPKEDSVVENGSYVGKNEKPTGEATRVTLNVNEVVMGDTERVSKAEKEIPRMMEDPLLTVGQAEVANGIEVEYWPGNTNSFLNSQLDGVVEKECKDGQPVGLKTGKWKRLVRDEARFDSSLVVDSQLDISGSALSGLRGVMKTIAWNGKYLGVPNSSKLQASSWF